MLNARFIAARLALATATAVLTHMIQTALRHQQRAHLYEPIPVEVRGGPVRRAVPGQKGPMRY